MLTSAILLIILSPFTAFIPAAYVGWKLYKQRHQLLEIPGGLSSPWNIGLVLLTFWAAMVGAFNQSPLSVAAALAFPLFLFVGLHLRLKITSVKDAEMLLKKVLHLSLIPAFLGVVEKILSLFIDMTWMADVFWSPFYAPTREAYRIYSTFGNPNVTGAWFAAMAIIAFFFFEQNKNKDRIRYGLMVALFILILVFTGSRGAVLGIEIALTAYVLFRKAKTNLVPAALTFVLVAGLTLMAPEINHPFNSRDYIWGHCIEMYQDKPFSGWGLLGIYAKTGDIHGHNIWISLAATLGSAGLLIFFYMKFHLFKNLWTLHKNNCHLTPLLGSLLALLFGHGLVDLVIVTPQGSMLFIGCIGIVNALAATYEEVDIPLLNTKPLSASVFKTGKAVLGEEYYSSK